MRQGSTQGSNQGSKQWSKDASKQPRVGSLGGAADHHTAPMRNDEPTHQRTQPYPWQPTRPHKNTPPKNNKFNYNLEEIWFTYKTKKIPYIHDYERIFIVASPSKYFAPFYYPNPWPIIISKDLIKYCINSWHMETTNFDKYSIWQFRISTIIARLCAAVPEKIIQKTSWKYSQIRTSLQDSYSQLQPYKIILQ